MRRIKSDNRDAFDDGWDKALITLERLVEKLKKSECGCEYHFNKLILECRECQVLKEVLAQIKELRK
jgi:hypothetical protein